MTTDLQQQIVRLFDTADPLTYQHICDTLDAKAFLIKRRLDVLVQNGVLVLDGQNYSRRHPNPSNGGDPDLPSFLRRGQDAQDAVDKIIDEHNEVDPDSAPPHDEDAPVIVPPPPVTRERLIDEIQGIIDECDEPMKPIMRRMLAFLTEHADDTELTDLVSDLQDKNEALAKANYELAEKLAHPAQIFTPGPLELKPDPTEYRIQRALDGYSPPVINYDIQIHLTAEDLERLDPETITEIQTAATKLLVLAHHGRSPDQPDLVDQVIKLACKAMNVENVHGQTLNENNARYIAIKTMQAHCGMSYQEIQHRLRIGNSTVARSIKCAEDSPGLMTIVNDIVDELDLRADYE